MRRLLERVGFVAFFAAWPLFFVYLRRSERTRVILEHEGKVLVVKNWISDNTWQLPGGGLHHGESLIKGAQREVREETGIALEERQIRYIGTETYRKYGHRFVFHIFVAQGFDVSGLKKQFHEISRVAWLSPSSLTVRDAAPDTLLSLDTWLRP